MHYSCWSQFGWHEATITAEEMGWGAKSYQHIIWHGSYPFGTLGIKRTSLKANKWTSIMYLKIQTEDNKVMPWTRFEGANLATAPYELYIALWCSRKRPSSRSHKCPSNILQILLKDLM